jgi:hypothetical protein
MNNNTLFIYIIVIMAPPGKTMLEKADAVVEISKKPLYLVTMGFVYIGYIILFLGISYISPDYIRAVSNITYAMIGLVLMYKFNPFKEATAVTEYDSKLIFISALFILFNLGVTEFALSFFKTVKSTFGL